MADLRPAPPEFMQRIRRLIAAYPDVLGHLHRARIEVLLRDKPEGSQTVQAWGEADTPDNPGEMRKFDFTVWFAWDIWQTLDDYERDAITFHELNHCGFDDKGKPLLLHHDFEIFNAEIAHFGIWWGEDAQATLDALNNMPPPHGAEGVKTMPLGYGGYQRPMRGNHGSSGAGNHGSSGAGNHGSSGAGNHGSSGARVAYSDPQLKPGDTFYTIDLGNGEVIELCEACYAAAAQSILGDLLSMLGKSA